MFAGCTSRIRACSQTLLLLANGQQCRTSTVVCSHLQRHVVAVNMHHGYMSRRKGNGDHFIFHKVDPTELIFPVDNLCLWNHKKISLYFCQHIMSY